MDRPSLVFLLRFATVLGYGVTLSVAVIVLARPAPDVRQEPLPTGDGRFAPYLPSRDFVLEPLDRRGTGHVDGWIVLESGSGGAGPPVRNIRF